MQLYRKHFFKSNRFQVISILIKMGYPV